jgi:hypothetical protein
MVGKRLISMKRLWALTTCYVQISFTNGLSQAKCHNIYKKYLSIFLNKNIVINPFYCIIAYVGCGTLDLFY